jgi:hypothetical protein
MKTMWISEHKIQIYIAIPVAYRVFLGDLLSFILPIFRTNSLCDDLHEHSVVHWYF